MLIVLQELISPCSLFICFTDSSTIYSITGYCPLELNQTSPLFLSYQVGVNGNGVNGELRLDGKKRIYGITSDISFRRELIPRLIKFTRTPKLL